MAVTKQMKQEQLADLKDRFKRAKTVSFAGNSGLSVLEVQELRGKLREKDSDMKVAKKTLMKIAAQEAGYKDIPDEVLAGAVGAVFTYNDDIIAGPKTIYEYAKKHEALSLLGALLDGKVLTKEEAKVLAMTPSKEELIAKLLFLFTYPMSGFVRALDAIAKKQEIPQEAAAPVAAETPAPAESSAAPEAPAPEAATPVAAETPAPAAVEAAAPEAPAPEVSEAPAPETTA
ncbi:MAG TPA: 50S ribosomal protein L10 [Candidatus Gracilibacteria bacterium]|nr:50S ribosomal protein L10 [Candidatus Gracilibacteria bacterium]